MTLRITIKADKNDAGYKGHVEQSDVDVDESGNMTPVQPVVDLKPGEEAEFYIHDMNELRVFESSE